jgi:hypothetical protein
MTLPRLDAIVARWEQVPPLSVSAASIAEALGVKREAAAAPRRKPKDEPGDDAVAAQQLLDQLASMGFSTERPVWLNQT